MAWDTEDTDGSTTAIGPVPGTDLSPSIRVPWSIVVALMLLVLLCSRKIRFYLKYHSFAGIYFFFGIISIPIMLFNACDPKSTRIPRLLVRRVQSPLFGITTKMIGMERYPEGPFVIVCNHQSSLDCIGLMELWPTRCVILMKKMLKYAGPFGLGAILAGSIFVDRSNNRSAKDTLSQAVKIIQTKGYRVFIFPEGTRKLPKESSGTIGNSEPLLPFKRGAFNLAILSQVPIVPVVFSSQKHLIDFKEYKFVSGEYTGVVLPPISTKGLTLEDVPDLSDRVRSQMIACFNELEQTQSR
ncbi:1-acyl-sn-glycerol-3-phosphate acyltransferase alpha-like [Lytechinus pictus]|uniref:1-acyl-sn-glycerol-3-phosphate acyltransferase alpha-like n=1 Tax=Lytechinus pictus TaxID=7653 RepID=UPI0030B9DF9C